MSVTTPAVLLPQAPWALPLLGLLVRGAAAAALLLLFRPLLVGLLRAALLVLRPRLSHEQRQARAAMRDRRLLQHMINAETSPSHAAELRALAARA